MLSSLTLIVYSRIPDHDDNGEQDQVPCGAGVSGGFVEGPFIGQVEVEPALYVVDF
jgi:hypothetical protein